MDLHVLKVFHPSHVLPSVAHNEGGRVTEHAEDALQTARRSDESPGQQLMRVLTPGVTTGGGQVLRDLTQLDPGQLLATPLWTGEAVCLVTHGQVSGQLRTGLSTQNTLVQSVSVMTAGLHSPSLLLGAGTRVFMRSSVG